MSEEKRRAVLEAVAELGYRPDPVARSLAERRTRTIGVVIDDLSNPWYVELLDGLRPVLHEHGLRPLLADGRTEPDAVQALSALRVDGLVLVGTPTASAVDQVNGLMSPIPTVIAGTREPLLPTTDVVANDDRLGGRLATQHLAAADELRLRVPADLSVVGYDNTVFSRLHRLSLTTIDSHSAEVGHVTGRTLTARLDGGRGTAQTRLLAPSLIRRSSTGRPRAG